MHKYYYTSEDIIYFYVSFKTINNGQNITITPNFDKYSINKRILEGYPNTIEITKNEEKTLLTKPSNNEKYLFTQMEICTPGASVEYEFYNAIYNSKLGETGKIEATPKNNVKNIENTYLDTYLVLKKINGNKETPEVFIKHSGVNEEYKPNIEEIKVSFDEKDQSTIKFNQPIKGEEFKYTIFIDKKDYLPKQNYNLYNNLIILKLLIPKQKVLKWI